MALASAPGADAADPALRHFTSLDPDRHRLPPAGTDPGVLTSAFVRPEAPGEAAVLERHLGVPRLDLTQLVSEHVGPVAPRLAAPALAGFLAGVLPLLPTMPAHEARALRAALW